MDVSAEQNDEFWINETFCVPSIPENKRAHYPFSKGKAAVYRHKLAVVLLNAAGALYMVEEPCLRLSLLLNGWLLFVTCEAVYKNYPWREPFTILLWKLYWTIPFSRVLLSICTVLLLLMLFNMGSGCELADPLAAMTVGWVCCMMSWPLVRESWHREERSEDDYDQFSSARSCALMLPHPFRVILAALRSPSFLCLLAAFLITSMPALFSPAWIADVWTAVTRGLLVGCFAVLCCHQLPDDVGCTLAAWEIEEENYARRIENCLRVVKGNLRTSGLPREGSTRFDRMAVHVPLLLREAKILRAHSRALTVGRAEELENLATAQEVLEFRRMLDDYGPYTKQCCVS